MTGLLKKMGWFFLIAIAILMVGDGKSGGDEASIYNLMTTMSKGGYSWSYLRSTVSGQWGEIALSHHLYWFFAKLPYFWLLEELSEFFSILANATVRDFIFSYYEAIILVVAIIASYFYLIHKRGYNKMFSFLVLALVWFGSYAICFLTGGHVENHLCLWIVIRLFLWDRLGGPKSRSFVLLGALDSVIIAIKAYALIFCLITTLGYVISQKVRLRFCFSYLIVVCLMMGLWTYVKQQIFPISEFYTGMLTDIGILETLEMILVRVIYQFFSFPYGLLWTFPAIVLPYFYWRKQPDLVIKSVAIFLTMASLAVFPFWHGATGIAGQRYIFPFLLFLLPNIADAFYCLCTKYRRAVLVVPVLVVLFFPVVNYRHNSVVALPGTMSATHLHLWNEYNNLPFFDIAYQPAVFAWKIQLAKWANKDSISVLDDGSVKNIEMSKVFPMTLYSRLSYITQTHSDVSEKYYALVGQTWLFNLRLIFTLDLLVWCMVLIICVFVVSHRSYPLKVENG